MTLKYLHFLNLDIVAGVAATGLLAERATGALLPGAHLPWSWWIVVPLTSWVIYTADRLIDVRLAPADHPTFRHQFHARNATLLTALCIVFGLAAGILALFTFRLDMLLAAPLCLAVIVAHHLLQRTAGKHFEGTLKDLNVVIVYTFATWYIPVLVGTFTWHSASILAAFVLIVTAIVLQLSIVDVEHDTNLGVSSSALELGVDKAMFIMRICCALAAACVIAPMSDDIALVAIVTLMCFCVTLLPLAFIRMQRPHARLLSELILSLPFLLLFFPHT